MLDSAGKPEDRRLITESSLRGWIIMGVLLGISIGIMLAWFTKWFIAEMAVCFGAAH